MAGSSGARRGGGGGSPPRRGPAPRPLGPPRRNARRGVPKPSKECEKNPHCGGQRAARPLAGGAARPVAPLGGFFARPADGAHFPLAPLRGAGFGCSWLHPLARLPGSRGSRGEGGLPALALLLWVGAFPALSFRPCFLVALPCPVSPWAGGCRPLRPHGRGRSRASRPQVRAAQYTESNAEGEERTKAGKTAQGTLYARLGLVPCASSFAIEPLRPYRKSDRTANTPAPGNGRKGTAAQKE